jgi:hypothetical protein
LARRRVDLGSLCTGGYALAKAGLLDNYRAAIHWENMSALREEFPRIAFVEQLFAIDRDRYTCSGGVAPLDLMLNMIKTHLGGDIAPSISEQFILDRIRSERDRQHIPLQAKVGLFHETLIKAAALMEANIESRYRSTSSRHRSVFQASNRAPVQTTRVGGLDTTWSCDSAGRANYCCRRRCRSWTSPLRAASSRRRISRRATGACSAIRRAPSDRCSPVVW